MTSFTLAEVLIVLGIIGLIADMTIPTLVNSYQKEVTLTQFKKIYTVLNQAFKMSEIENDSGKYWESATSNESEDANFQRYWAPYLRIQKYCKKNNSIDCGYKQSYFSGFSKSSPNTIGITSRPTVVLQDGMIFQANGTTSDSQGNIVPYNYMFVDLNGAKPPNTFGKDVFRFYVSSQGKGIVPDGTGKEDAVIDADCISTGFYCGAKIIKDGWKITYW